MYANEQNTLSVKQARISLKENKTTMLESKLAIGLLQYIGLPLIILGIIGDPNGAKAWMTWIVGGAMILVRFGFWVQRIRLTNKRVDIENRLREIEERRQNLETLRQELEIKERQQLLINRKIK